MKLLFTDSAAKFILEALGNRINSAGCVINNEKNEFVEDVDGKILNIKDFIGTHKGKYYTSIFQFKDKELKKFFSKKMK